MLLVPDAHGLSLTQTLARWGQKSSFQSIHFPVMAKLLHKVVHTQLICLFLITCFSLS